MGKKSRKKRHGKLDESNTAGKRAFGFKKKESVSDERATNTEGIHITSRWGQAFLLAGVTCLLFLVYGGSFKGPLLFDSFGNILLFSSMQMDEVSLEEVKNVVTGAHLRERPVANLSLALNYLFSGTEARGYRIVNVLIHLSTGILLFLLIRSTLRTPALSDRGLPDNEIAFSAALLWLFHPLAVQSVAYVVQRMNSQAAMFYVLTLWLYVQTRFAAPGRRRVALALSSAVAGFLAIGSKEIAATLPVFVILYEWYFFRDLKSQWLKRSAGAVLSAAAFVLISLIYLEGDPVGRIVRGYERRDFTMLERLLTEGRVVVHYLSQFLFPHPSRLSIEHEFELSRSLLSPPSTALALILLAGLAFAAVWTARRQRLVSFSLLWFFGNLAIESSIIPIEIIFEHRTYIPSMFLAVLFVLLLHKIFRRALSRHAALIALVALMSLWTHQRAEVWGDDLTFWQDAMDKAPNKSRPHHNLGVVLRDRQRFRDAIPRFRRAIEIDPGYALAYSNLGHALMKIGETEEALEVYTQGIKADPSNAKLHFDRSLALARLGRTDEEIDALKEALRLRPEDPKALNNLGATLLNRRRFGEAIEILTRAVKIQPEYASAHFNLGQALKAAGRTKEGEHHLALARQMRTAPQR